MSIGERLKWLRKQKQWTQDDLATPSLSVSPYRTCLKVSRLTPSYKMWYIGGIE